MLKKAIGTLVLLFIALVTMNFHCYQKPDVIRPYEQAFQIPVSITPLKKSYRLTDTIWLETVVSGKLLFDTKSNQSLPADTGAITFAASFNEFGTSVTSPAGGFCEVITPAGANQTILQGQWSTGVWVNDYGCGQTDYKIRIGFRPTIKGNYWLILNNNYTLTSCSNKKVPYYATISFKYNAADLNLDVFNSLLYNDKGGSSSSISFYTNKINNGELFVFRVE